MFKGLGGMFDMMKQAQEMQGRLQSVMEEVGRAEVDGTSGGGLVVVTLSGNGDLKRLKIDPSLIRPDEPEVVADLIIAAHADAKAKAETEKQRRMSEFAGGLGLPPGLKLPGM